MKWIASVRTYLVAASIIACIAIAPSRSVASGPWIRYSKFVGGPGDDQGNAVAIWPGNRADHLDEVYIVGQTKSDGLATGDVFQTSRNEFDANGFIGSLFTSLNAVHGLSYFSLRKADPGNTSYDSKAFALALDHAGLVWFGGTMNFGGGVPCHHTSAYVTVFTGGLNFPNPVVRETVNLTDGRNGEVLGVGLWPPGLTDAKSAYVCGWTSSSGHTKIARPAGPTLAGSFQDKCMSCVPVDPTKCGGHDIEDIGDAFVARVDMNNALRGPAINPIELKAWTYLGASEGHMRAQGIAIGNNSVFITGQATGLFPRFRDASNPHVFVSGNQETVHGASDAFVARFNLDLTKLEFFTFIGGSGNENDHGGGITIDASGNVYVTGGSASSDFTTTDGSSGPGAFVVKFDPTLHHLLYSAVLTDKNASAAYGLSIALGGYHEFTKARESRPSRDIFVCGGVTGGWLLNSTESAVKPGKGTQAFLVKLTPGGSTYRTVYATYLGSSCSVVNSDGATVNSTSEARSVAVEPDGTCAYVVGEADCPDFCVFYKPRPGVASDLKIDPRTAADQPPSSHGGKSDAFVCEVVFP